MSDIHKKTKVSKKNTKSSKDPSKEDMSDALVENLYKKNVELLVKNKTLSLLSKLYEISILTLEPKDLAMRVCQTVQVDLSLELVGIYTFEAKSDRLVPLAFSKSERVNAALEKLSLILEDTNILGVAKHKFFEPVLQQKKQNMTNDIEKIWGDYIEHSKLHSIVSQSNIKTSLIYPLMVQSRVLGAIMLSLNRDYETLSSFEKESIKSFVNMIALALEKAYLYKELEDANTQLRELDRQKDELLSIVSHQLATPVSSVKWYLEMLLDGDIGELKKEQKDHVNTAYGVTTELTDLVSMILDVSRIQLGKMKIEAQELDLNTFFKEILDIIVPKATEKNVHFEYKVSENLPKTLLDKRYTKMTIENLLSNAVKYTPANGTVNFLVEVRNDSLYCEVKDTGCGIPKSDQDKIFGKLFRASNVRNTVDGNGFGLYIAKGAIESQGGKIWFESQEGKGTTFFIELPLQPLKA